MITSAPEGLLTRDADRGTNTAEITGKVCTLDCYLLEVRSQLAAAGQRMGLKLARREHLSAELDAKVREAHSGS